MRTQHILLFLFLPSPLSIVEGDHENTQLTTTLKESQEGLEKARGELDAHHARVSHLLAHISPLVKLHHQDNPNHLLFSLPGSKAEGTISEDLAQLYHHMCTLNGEIPSRVLLDHSKQGCTNH